MSSPFNKGALFSDYYRAMGGADFKFQRDAKVRGTGIALLAHDIIDDIDGDEQHPIIQDLRKMIAKIERTFGLLDGHTKAVWDLCVRLEKHGLAVQFPEDAVIDDRIPIYVFAECSDEKAEDVVKVTADGKEVRLRIVETFDTTEELFRLEKQLVQDYSNQRLHPQNINLRRVWDAYYAVMEKYHHLKTPTEQDEAMTIAAREYGVTVLEVQNAFQAVKVAGGAGMYFSGETPDDPERPWFALALRYQDSGELAGWYDDFEDYLKQIGHPDAPASE